ncbi:AAA domain-containing protein [Streptomyces sp. NPDC057694]|uniref:AAA domain-containing protein n=1 Tax=Streptomyces sp. NPDC057694 TaxID=3346216 RepID=UPI0036CC5BFA
MPLWLEEMTQAVSQLCNDRTAGRSTNTEADRQFKHYGDVVRLEEGWFALSTYGRAVDPDNLADLCLGGVLEDAQAQLYLACTTLGIRLVWGPPGTGNTTVLKRALMDLVARNKRVLLVSGTNVAVDNVLDGAMKAQVDLRASEFLRVGAPHQASVAEDSRVRLSLLVRERRCWSSVDSSNSTTAARRMLLASHSHRLGNTPRFRRTGRKQRDCQVDERRGLRSVLRSVPRDA